MCLVTALVVSSLHFVLVLCVCMCVRVCVHACVQVVIALSGGELVYFEMDMVSEEESRESVNRPHTLNIYLRFCMVFVSVISFLHC